MKRFALAGNPNSGKTTLFNALTGSTAHVGNWPGVTVDKKDGKYEKLDEPISIIDLPGIYSLSPYTPEEIISRNYILDEKPDCVINIVDATNLERNLYLTTQLMEIDVPIVIALNMMDLIRKEGTTINLKELEKAIGLPVVEVSALKEENLDELMKVAHNASKNKRNACSVLEGSALTHLIKDVEIAFKGIKVDNPLFHAIKLIENDEVEITNHEGLINVVDDFKATFNDDIFGTDFEAVIADARYKHITSNYSPCLKRSVASGSEKLSKSDKIDKVMTNKWLGIPIFLFILFVIYHFTFSEDFLFLGSIFNLPSIEDLGLLNADGEPLDFGVKLLSCVYDGGVKSPGYILFYLMDLITATLSEWIVLGLEAIESPAWVLGLIGDGVLGGLCGILSFVPQIVFLLLLLAILEDSGYMARVAFILDRLFRKFGVSGRAFIPMIMGFGCSIPAMVNTRTLNNDRERTMTIRTIPFFTCGAKLPVLGAIAGCVAHYFGLGDGSFISFIMVVLGMVIAVLAIVLMNHTTQRGEIPPFIMELPTYHVPSGKSLMIHLWDKTKHYIQKVFTIILASTIVLWFLTNFGWNWQMVEDMENSILASLGQLIQPIFTPLGFGSQLNSFGWVFAVAAITGLIAKEEVVSTIAVLGAIFANIVAPEIGAEGASDIYKMMVGTGISWQGLISFLIFNMTTIPCFAAVAAAKGEIQKGKFKWTLLFWVALSYVVSSISYLVLTNWWTSFIVVGVIIILALLICYYNKKHPIKN